MIIALAGRRVDAVDATVHRFPLQNVEQVRQRTREILQDHGATVLVSSAACGADLIALSEAGLLGLRRRVILPYGRMRFRETSVSDRPGGWGPLYDQILDEVDSVSDLVILGDGSDEEAYTAANQAILDEAIAIGRSAHEFLIAVLVWDGISSGDHDLTEEFAIEARNRGLEVAEVRSD